MIIRQHDGSLVEVNKSDFVNDNNYYRHIINIVFKNSEEKSAKTRLGCENNKLNDPKKDNKIDQELLKYIF